MGAAFRVKSVVVRAVKMLIARGSVLRPIEMDCASAARRIANIKSDEWLIFLANCSLVAGAAACLATSPSLQDAMLSVTKPTAVDVLMSVGLLLHIGQRLGQWWEA